MVRNFGKKFTAGLSKLHSMCPEDHFAEKHFQWKKLKVYKIFRISGQKVWDFFQQILGLFSETFLQVCQNCNLFGQTNILGFRKSFSKRERNWQSSGKRKTFALSGRFSSTVINMAEKEKKCNCAAILFVEGLKNWMIDHTKIYQFVFDWDLVKRLQTPTVLFDTLMSTFVIQLVHEQSVCHLCKQC